MRDILLALSILITIGSVVPYIRDILKGSTRPNIVSWITWTLLTGVATVAEFSAGEYTTALFTAGATVETLLIVILGLRYGYVKYTKFDITCQIAALVGFVLWFVFNSPVAAVIAALAIDLVGALPTVKHCWVSPGEETWTAYGMCAVGGVLALLAMTAYNWVSVPYAVYIVLINVTMSAIILYRVRLTG